MLMLKRTSLITGERLESNQKWNILPIIIFWSAIRSHLIERVCCCTREIIKNNKKKTNKDMQESSSSQYLSLLVVVSASRVSGVIENVSESASTTVAETVVNV